MKMSERDALMYELYNTLEKLHYPEVAQIPYEQFETTILNEGKQRIDMLYWLLLENGEFNSSSLTRSKDNCSRSDKIVKYYSHMGLCSDEKIVLGQCPIDDQLQFLSLLISFIKAINPCGNVSQKCDKETKNNLLKADISDSNSIPKINIESTDKTETKLSNISKYLSNETISDKSHTKVTEWNIQESIENLMKQKPENCDSMIQKYNSCFEEIPTLQKKNSQDILESCNDIATDLQKIYSSFSYVDKALVNEVKMKNQPALELSTSKFELLSQEIKANLVLFEQVHNCYDTNDSDISS